jgi:leucyl aminopeptidase
MFSFSKKEKFSTSLKGFYQDSKEYASLKKEVNLKKGETLFFTEKGSDKCERLLFLGEQKEISYQEISSFFNIFVLNNKCNVDVDISSFCADKKIDSQELQKKLLETYLLTVGEKVNYKLKPAENLKNTNYNFFLRDFSPIKETEVEKIKIICEEIIFARNLQDFPPNILYPETFIEKVKTHIKELKKKDSQNNLDKLEVEVLSKKEITAKKMNLLLAVNSGSEHEPYVLILNYKSKKSDQKTVLVGKGITFDSGGYSLKPSVAMKGMKFDMSGAAIVTATLIAIARLGLKTNVSSIVCLTENKIGSKATLVDSVITSMAGKSVEIRNTDAEGRLILADALHYACHELQATNIIELSTLTGAIIVGLGKEYAGAFTNTTDNDFCQKFIESSKEVGELV